MKQNKFKIVIPSYNNEKWYEANIASILNQTYKNYDVLYIDDASTDNTYQVVSNIVSDLPNWKVVSNEQNMRRGYNLSPYNPLLIDFIESDDDILVFIDGDDWLYDDKVLESLNNLYNENEYWMTYGKFVCYPSGDLGNPQNTPYPIEVHEQNAYRRDTWRASHLRTFRWHLYKQIKKEDLIFSKTGEFYFHAEDLATSFPCLEMCPKDKIGVVDFITYVYNVSQEARERVEKDLSREPGGYQYELQIRESEIRNRKPYNVIDNQKIIISSLGGGLGNMLFMTAAATGLSKKHNHKQFFYDNHYGILHGKPMSYKDTVFRNLPLLEHNLAEVVPVGERSFHYTPIEAPNENVIVNGYFQSQKYFEHCKDEVRELFSCPDNIRETLLSKYDVTDTVSLHIRRGNYVQLSYNHYNLSLGYYRNAVDYFKGYKFLVFSDDIEWCKENFKGEEFTFAEGKNEVKDLYLMSLCTHNVIANSTFSWWGAFLNKNPNKTVIYPDKWFGPGYKDWKTSDLFPEEWICLTEDEPQITVNLFDGAFGHLVKPNGRYSSVHDKISRLVKYTKNNPNFDGITIFTDGDIKNPAVASVQSKYKIGWLLETRELHGGLYNEFESYKDNFDFVMTHDSELLTKYPDKTRLCIFGGTWIKNKNYWIHNKTKNVSMIYSGKQYMTGHKLRHEVASNVEGIDLYGHGSPRPIRFKEEALLDYRFSIIIENSKTDNYFTEKLVDCFMVGTVPIYWGAPNIDKYFDTRGMIIVNSLEEIKEVVGKLNENEYVSKMEYIKTNLETARSFDVTEDWMYNNILKDLK
jgi:glycosyltransferase involved in cell wall biosynthesis